MIKTLTLCVRVATGSLGHRVTGSAIWAESGRVPLHTSTTRILSSLRIELRPHPIIRTTNHLLAEYPRSIHHTTLHLHGRLTIHCSSNSIGWRTEADPAMIHRSTQHHRRAAPTWCSPVLHIGLTGFGQSTPDDLGPTLYAPIRVKIKSSVQGGHGER